MSLRASREVGGRVSARVVGAGARAWLAAWLVALCVVIGSAGVARAQAVSPDAAAQVRFNRGRELFLARDYDAALAEFRAALALVASPNTRMYIARCLREGGHLAEAYTEMQRAAGEASDRSARDPRYAATRDAARAEAEALHPRIGTLTVHVPYPPADATVTVGGAAVPSAGWDVPTPVDPGRVAVAANAPGRRAFGTTVDVRAGQNTDVTIELPVDPNAAAAGASGGSSTNTGGTSLSAVGTEPTGPLTRRETVGGGVRIAGGVVMGVGALLGIGFVVFGTLAQSRYSDLEAVCNDGGSTPAPCDGRVPESQIAEGEQYQTLANVSLGLGIGLLVVGTVMVIAGGPRTVEVPVTRGALEPRGRRAGAAGLLRAVPWGAALGNGANGGVAGLRLAF